MAWLASLLVIPDVATWGDLNIGAGLMAVILSAFAFKTLHFMPDAARKTRWAAGVGVGILTLLFPHDQSWLIPCITLGVIVHIAGDMLTKEGCNLLWPLRIRRPKHFKYLPAVRQVWGRNGHFAMPLLGSAHSIRSWVVTIPISAVAILGMLRAGTYWGQELWATLMT